MDNQRIFLWMALGLLLWMNYQAWLQDHRVPPPSATAPAAGPESSAEAELPAPPELPAAPAGDTPAGAAAPSGEAPVSGARLRIVTDVLEAGISLTGGDLVSATLPDYPVHKDQPDIPVQLLDPDPNGLFVLRAGLRATESAASVDSSTVYKAQGTEFRLAPGEDVLEVPLTAELPGVVTVTRTWRFERGSYEVGLTQRVDNGGEAPWSGASWLQLRRLHEPPKRSFTDVESYSFRGPVVFNGESYEKLDIEDLAAGPVKFVAPGGWVASIQHHFLAAAVPGSERASFLATANEAGIYTLSAVGLPVEVAPGQSAELQDRLFVGPKLQDQLEKTAPKLRLTVDYGWLTIIAQPLFWVLSKIHGLVGNWGWSIIFLTLLIKLAFYKLSETSGKSMAKMRKLQPRMKALQERYADDRQKLSQAMMELYRKEKVNPAAGCLPIIVQMPVFLALYWVLLESVEMRQAPFMLWIDDLSAKDPYFILPLLMGVTMFFQQKLNPAPPDPLQAKVMQILPVVFTVFFAFFPAGLVLYWFVNNLLSILQQWHINRTVERMA